MDHPEIFAYTRTFEDQVFLVLLNFSGNTPEFVTPQELSKYSRQVVLTNYERTGQSDAKFEMKPYEAIVYQLK